MYVCKCKCKYMYVCVSVIHVCAGERENSCVRLCMFVCMCGKFFMCAKEGERDGDRKRERDRERDRERERESLCVCIYINISMCSLQNLDRELVERSRKR